MQMYKHSLCLLALLATSLLTGTSAQPPAPYTPDPSTGILRFHHMHDGGFMFQANQKDNVTLWVDVSNGVPSKVKIQLSNGQNGKGTPDATGFVFVEMPSMITQNGLTATVQVDNKPYFLVDKVAIGHKFLWTGQSEAAMTEKLMNDSTTYPLIRQLMNHPRCEQVYFYHAITVLLLTVVPPGASSTPVDDLPAPPTHGWINCRTPGFTDMINSTTNSLDGFSKTGLAIAINFAFRTNFEIVTMVYQTSAISTVLVAWSSQDMITKADVHKYVIIPRNALNTATYLFNGQLNPIRHYKFAHVVRFQLESDSIENKIEGAKLLPYWHNGMRSDVFANPKQRIAEIQLCPYTGGGPGIPGTYDILRDAQEVVEAFKYSHLVPTSDLHDEVGRNAADRGLHNQNGVTIASRVVDWVLGEYYNVPGVQYLRPLAYKFKLEYDDDNTVTLDVNFKNVRPDGLSTNPTPFCSLCLNAPSPVEIRLFNSTWLPVSTVLAPGDEYSVSGTMIHVKLLNAAFRPVVNGLRHVATSQMNSFVGDGYPIKTFAFQSPMASV